MTKVDKAVDDDVAWSHGGVMPIAFHDNVFLGLNLGFTARAASVRGSLTHDSRVTLQLIKYYYIIFGLTPIVLSILHCLLMQFHCSDPSYQKQGHENTVIYIL